MRAPPNLNPPKLSPLQTYIAGQTLEFVNWLPPEGPAGGRNMIAAIVVRLTGTMTVGTADWSGRDVSKLLRVINVQDMDGESRWNLSGTQSQNAAIVFDGIENWHYHPNVTTGSGKQIELYHRIPFARDRIRRAKDWALAVSDFHSIKVTCAAAADAATGTSVLSALSLQAYCYAELYEQGDRDGGTLEVPNFSSVSATAFTNQTQARVNIDGRCHGLFLMKEGTTAGGEDISAITDVRCADLGVDLTTRRDLELSYRQRYSLGATGPTTASTERFLEPVLTGQVIPLIMPTVETSAWDGALTGEAKIDVGTGVAGASVVVLVTRPKNRGAVERTRRKFKVGGATARVKTAKGTKRDPSEWDNDKRAYMPIALPYNGSSRG